LFKAYKLLASRNRIGENMSKVLVFLEGLKNGMIWVVIFGTLGDLLLFYSINSNPDVSSQITSLGISILWLYIIWPIIIFVPSAAYAAEIEYKKTIKEEDVSVGLNILGLNRDWRTATTYLCALDVMINKKRKALGIIDKDTSKERESFKERFGGLIKVIKENNADLGETIEKFANNLWEVRTPIVHYGRVPNREELDLIKSTTEKIIKVLSDI